MLFTYVGMVIFDYKYGGSFGRQVNISYLLRRAGGDINRLHNHFNKKLLEAAKQKQCAY